MVPQLARTVHSSERILNKAPAALHFCGESILLNNVNLKEMEKFVEAVRKDSKQAIREKSVTGEWVFRDGQPQFVAEIQYPKGKVSLACELPAFAGGWGGSPDPIQYCLYGLAACFASTLVATATNEKIELRSLRVTAENRVDLRKQLGLSNDPIIQSVKLRVSVEADAPRASLE